MFCQDVGEFGIAPRRVAATKHYTSQQQQKPHSKQSSGIIPGMELLQELVVPAK